MKRAGGVAQGIGPEFKPQYHNNNKIFLIEELQLISAEGLID
jgi:hypothetical protein